MKGFDNILVQLSRGSEHKKKSTLAAPKKERPDWVSSEDLARIKLFKPSIINWAMKQINTRRNSRNSVRSKPYSYRSARHAAVRFIEKSRLRLEYKESPAFIDEWQGWISVGRGNQVDVLGQE